jgi:hypothetical protein
MTDRPSRGLDLIGLVFLIWLAAGALGFGRRAVNADGDIARHIVHGERILDTGGVIRADRFSFTRAGEPFTGFEYGSQVAFALAHRAAGLPGVALLAALLWATALALTCRFLLRRGVEPGFAYLLVFFAAVLSAMHFAARPHLVTQVLALVLLDWLDRDERPPLWWFAVLFALWANLHGGWLFGLILIGTYGVGAVLDSRPARARGLAAALAVGAVVTVLNPYGPALPLHVLGFFGAGLIQSQTTEFKAPEFRDLGTRLFLLSALAVTAAYALAAARPRWDRLLTVLALMGFALMARRNIALWALVALPIAAIHADGLVRRLPEPPNFRASFARAAARPWRWSLAAGLILLLSAVAVLEDRTGRPGLMPREFEARIFPRELVAEARAAGVEGRLFNQFLWGGWLLYAWPEQKVFIDGGTDFYGEDLLYDYLSAWTIQPDWRERLEKWQVGWVLVDAGSPLAGVLAHEAGWSRWGAAGIGALYCRTSEPGCLH